MYNFKDDNADDYTDKGNLSLTSAVFHHLIDTSISTDFSRQQLLPSSPTYEMKRKEAPIRRPRSFLYRIAEGPLMRPQETISIPTVKEEVVSAQVTYGTKRVRSKDTTVRKRISFTVYKGKWKSVLAQCIDGMIVDRTASHTHLGQFQKNATQRLSAYQRRAEHDHRMRMVAEGNDEEFKALLRGNNGDSLKNNDTIPIPGNMSQKDEKLILIVEDIEEELRKLDMPGGSDASCNGVDEDYYSSSLTSGDLYNISSFFRVDNQYSLCGEASNRSSMGILENKVTLEDIIKCCLIDLPIFSELMPFQQEGVKWIFRMWCKGNNTILADEMGLGKTVQSIAVLWAVHEALNRKLGIFSSTSQRSHNSSIRQRRQTTPEHTKGAKTTKKKPHLNSEVKLNSKSCLHPHLIVAPLSTLPNWEAELARFTDGRFRVATLNGTLNERSSLAAKAYDGQYDVVIAPFDIFAKRQSSTALNRLKKCEWGMIVVDEAQRIKNANCSLLTTLGNMTFHAGKLILSGTPLQNSISEMFSFLKFILPTAFLKKHSHQSLIDKLDGALRSSFIQGKKALSKILECNKKESNKPNSDEDDEYDIIDDDIFADEELRLFVCRKVHKLLEPFILRRERQEVLREFPAKDEHLIHCPLTKTQSTKLQEMRDRKARKEYRGSNYTLDCRKVLMHPFLMSDFFYVDEQVISSSGKFVALDIMTSFLWASNRHKFLIFSNWTKVLDVIDTMCIWRRMPFVRICGKTPPEERSEFISQFNSKSVEELPCFLISKIAGGVGLNLQTADTVFLMDIDYNPQRDLQALSRVYRVGQTRHVKVFRLVITTDGDNLGEQSGNTLSTESKMLAIAEEKKLMADAVVNAGQYNLHASDVDRDAAAKKIIYNKSDSCSTDKAPSYGIVSKESLETQIMHALPRGDDEVKELKDFLEKRKKRSRN